MGINSSVRVLGHVRPPHMDLVARQCGRLRRLMPELPHTQALILRERPQLAEERRI